MTSTPLVLGTAGHIDHGKTALIRALTGVETDRLPEEKARGITIDLGFAPLDLGGGVTLSVVDVPGHEGLVRTMVAGASGIDLLLLVVAADEGVMPQTREHLAICELLGLDRGVVALNKIDAVDPELRELAREDVSVHLAASGLAGAEVVPVSARTGEGLDTLRASLRAVALEACARTPRQGPARLPVDRSFAMKGFGTVVTGTLIGGPLRVGDAVELQPSGLRARVRGLQRFGEAVASAEPGARCAVNLHGVDTGDVARGETLGLEGQLATAPAADVALRWLRDAPPLDAPASVEFLTGTAERRARLAPIAGPLQPGASGFARVHLEGEPLALLPGDRFVVRGFAATALGGSTLGGGVLLDAPPAHRRLSDPVLLEELRTLESRDLVAELRVRVERAGLAGVGEQELVRRSGRPGQEVASALSAEREAGRMLCDGEGRWLAAPAVARIESRLCEALDAFHRDEPLRPAMARGALRGRLPTNVPADVADLALERLAKAGEVEVEGDGVRRASHRVELAGPDREVADRIVGEAVAAGLEPPLPKEWSERLGVSPARLRELLAHLERSGELVRAPGDLFFHAAAVARLRERVAAHLEQQGELTTPAYKALIGTTRKYAVPLMELFDDERLTARRGQVRILRRRS